MPYTPHGRGGDAASRPTQVEPTRRTRHDRQPSNPEPRKNLGDEMLTLDEAAALLRVPEDTLRYWR